MKNIVPQPGDTFRVVKIGQAQKDRMRLARTNRGTTNKEMLRLAVEQELDGLLEELAAVGIEPLTDAGPVRLPFDDTTLVALREASDATHVPAVALLRICLRRWADKALQPDRPRRGRKAAKKGGGK
jgi:hypothetical protein